MLCSGDIWVNGWEGLYAVNRNLDVVSFRKNRKILKQAKLPNGYFTVCFTAKDGSKKNYYVHRLLAEAFVPNPEKLPQVNHKNRDRADNRLENLEWVTPSGNTRHAWEEGSFDEYLNRLENTKLSLIKDMVSGNKPQQCFNLKKHHSCENQFVENGVPYEVIDCALKKSNFKEQWIFIYSVYRDIDKGVDTLTAIANRYDLTLSMVSRIKTGVRWKKQRRIYDKYKNNQYYTHYI